MSESSTSDASGPAGFLPRTGLQRLLDVLRNEGFACIGPTVEDGAIVYRRITDVQALPEGVHDEQGPGRYRVRRDGGRRSFAFATGPQALKPLLFAPREALWRARRDAEGGLHFEAATPAAERLAVIGVRACDLAALALHDRHFLHGAVRDPAYAARRAGLFLVAVNCSHPAATCFCASTGDGPRTTTGFDLALDELDDGFVVGAGSERGAEVARRLGLQPASASRVAEAQHQSDEAARVQERRLPGRHLRDSLFAALAHPRWKDVAERCLSCGNCTAVCPTCFCHAENDHPSLDGTTAEHDREWDSCFTAGHSRIHGLTVRADTASRYRQWLTHKLGSWHDQYGRSGCVGCGRCITWCPAGIDLTEEATVICGGPA